MKRTYEIKRHNGKDALFWQVYYSDKFRRSFFMRLFFEEYAYMLGRYTHEFDSEKEAQDFIDRQNEAGTTQRSGCARRLRHSISL